MRALLTEMTAPRVLAICAFVALAAGCGAGANAPSVASLGDTTGGSSTTPAVPKGGSFVKFVNCLQTHGVDAQLGPGGKGVSIQGGPADSSKLASAQEACREYLPGGGPKQLTPQQEAKFLKQMVKLAKCMRAHGVSDFPDPSASGTGFPFAKVPSANTPQFETAAKACGAAGPNGNGFAIKAPG